MFDGVRSRVEKIISKPTGMGLFHNGKCRLGYDLLLAAVKVTLHTSAVWSRLPPQCSLPPSRRCSLLLCVDGLRPAAAACTRQGRWPPCLLLLLLSYSL